MEEKKLTAKEKMEQLTGQRKEKVEDYNGGCEKCQGRLFLINEHGNAYRCECWGTRLANNRTSFATIPERYKNVSFSDFKTASYKLDKSKTQIRECGRIIKLYLDEFEEFYEEGTGLYICSSTKGSGKTMMMAIIANELIKKHRIKFATSIEILQEIKNTYGDKPSKTEEELLKLLVETDILFVDDFGTEKITDWVAERFYSIINKRYSNKKVTIYTSNYDLETLGYDERITNRVKETSIVVRFPEESVREHIFESKNKGIFER